MSARNVRPSTNTLAAVSLALSLSACSSFPSLFELSPLSASGTTESAKAPATFVVRRGEPLDQSFERLGHIDGSVYVLAEGGQLVMAGDSAPIGNIADLAAYLTAHGLDVAVSVKEPPYVRVMVTTRAAANPVANKGATPMAVRGWSTSGNDNAAVTLANWAAASGNGWRVIWLARGNPMVKAGGIEAVSFEDAAARLKQSFDGTENAFRLQFDTRTGNVLRVLDPINVR